MSLINGTFGNPRAIRHVRQYIERFVGYGEYYTHSLGKTYLGWPAGTPFTILDTTIIQTNTRQTYGTVAQIGSQQLVIPNNIIVKPKELVNNPGLAGFAQEKHLHQLLIRYGLSKPDIAVAGSSSGPDVPLVINNKVYNIESKVGPTAKFGEISLKYTDRWVVSERSYKRAPAIVDDFISQKVNGICVLEYLNQYWGNPSNRQSLPVVNTDLTTCYPIYKYLKTIKADILYIATHGAYSVDNDPLNIGLPEIEDDIPASYYKIGRYGVGRPVAACLKVYGPAINKSEFDLTNEKLLQYIAKKTGTITNGAIQERHPPIPK